MANTIMTSVYNQYLSTYAPKKSAGRLDSHNQNELKNICRHITRLNKEAPLYILDRSQEAKGFAISVKENARELQHTLLNIAGNAQSDLFKSRIAYSSNEDILSASYIGTAENAEEIPTYNIEVMSLASPQVNLGNFLPSDDMSLVPGDYSFDVNVNGLGYEFQYTIGKGDTNLDVQRKLSRLVNRSGIGLESSVIDGMDGTSALQIASTKTGIPAGQEGRIFTITDDKTSRQSGSVSYLGLDYVSTKAANAQFLINGEEASASSNHFTIEKNFEVTLNGISSIPGETITVGVKPNTEALKDNIRSLIGGYNNFLRTMNEYQGAHAKSEQLVKEMNSISHLYVNDLDAVGIVSTADGSLEIQDEVFDQAVVSENAQDLFLPVKDFSSSLFRKSEQVSLDPLNYVQKTIVAYKNPGKNFPSPYVSSNYSGLLFNYYC